MCSDTSRDAAAEVGAMSDLRFCVKRVGMRCMMSSCQIAGLFLYLVNEWRPLRVDTRQGMYQTKCFKSPDIRALVFPNVATF